MKFYYNDKLIRTSKNHTYTHAVIDTTTGKVIGCRANRETAEAIISTEIAQYLRGIANCETAIKALENGRNGYMEKDGRRSYFHRFTTSDTAKKFRDAIDWRYNHINEIKANWKVVELEARA